jgi:hypothetical protein
MADGSGRLTVQERSMNFTRLAFPAVLAGAVLMNPIAHAQTPRQAVAKALRDTGKSLMQTWATDMRTIVDGKIGPERLNALVARTRQLSSDLGSLKACASNEDTDYLRTWLISFKVEQKLPIEMNYKPQCDFDRHEIVNGDVAIASFHNDIQAEDAVYSQGTAMTGFIKTNLEKWASAERAAIDASKDPNGLKQKVKDIATRYEALFDNTTCYKTADLNFKEEATKQKEAQKLPLHLTVANATCQDNHHWHVTLTVDLEERDAGWPGPFAKWSDISGTVLPKASTLTTDAKRQEYAKNLGRGGEYIRKINTVACSEEDAVVRAFKEQASTVASFFSSFNAEVSRCKEGHLNFDRVAIEFVKPK